MFRQKLRSPGIRRRFFICPADLTSRGARLLARHRCVYVHGNALRKPPLTQTPRFIPWLDLVVRAHDEVSPHVHGAVLQLLPLLLAGHHAARTAIKNRARRAVEDAALATDELDVVVGVAAAGESRAPAPGQELFHQRPADAQARDDDGDAGLDREPLEGGHLAPGEVLLVDLQDGDEPRDADADVEDAEAEDERQRHLAGAGHLQLPRRGDGQRPDDELDGETPRGDGGHDGDLGETGAGLGGVPVSGEGDAAEGDDEDGEDDPEGVDDVAGQDWESSVRAVSHPV